MNIKKCCFIGHRKINITSQIEQKVRNLIEELILNCGISVLLFGSRSDFNDICHKIVSDLKEKYKNIKRIAYTCKSEACILENERLYMEEIYSKYYKRKVVLYGVEEEFEFSAKYKSGKAS
ncbi:MAG: hypothetical protein ACI4MI_03265 [Christensenellales bacterium]